MDERNRQAIEKLGIYELRTLARKVGVPSPTTKKREELVSRICQIMAGESTGEGPKSRAGRPPKVTKLNESVIDFFVPQDFVEEANRFEIANKPMFDNSTLHFDASFDFSILQGRESIYFEGYLRKTKEGSPYVKSNTNIIFVPANVVSDKGFIEGDYIEGTAWKIENKNYCLFADVDKVNGSEEWRDEIDEMTDIVLKEKFDEGKVFEEVYDDFDKFLVKENTVMLDYIHKGYMVLSLVVGASTTDFLKVEKYIPSKIFSNLYDENPRASQEAVFNIISHASALARRGKKVIIFVHDISNVAAELDLCYNLDENRVGEHSYNTILVLRKLFGLARFLKSGGSITIVNGVPKEFASGMKPLDIY